MGRRRKLNIYNLFDNVIPEPMSGCWLWEYSTNNAGYGKVHLQKKDVYAHRLSYMAHVGPIPKDKFVLHKCDVRCCINPDHLFLGTQKDNVQDMIGKNRSKLWHNGENAGEANGRARLKTEDIIEIRTRRMRVVEYAGKFGISKAMVYRILKREKWKHVP